MCPPLQQNRGTHRCIAHRCAGLTRCLNLEQCWKGSDLVNPGSLQGGVVLLGSLQYKKPLPCESSALLLEHSTGRAAWAGDALRRAGNCTCLDLVCDEHCWLVLALGLGLWNFGLRTAWPEIGFICPLQDLPK